jgi:hypothetical protein
MVWSFHNIRRDYQCPVMSGGNPLGGRMVKV